MSFEKLHFKYLSAIIKLCPRLLVFVEDICPVAVLYALCNSRCISVPNQNHITSDEIRKDKEKLNNDTSEL